MTSSSIIVHYIISPTITLEDEVFRLIILFYFSVGTDECTEYIYFFLYILYNFELIF